MFKNAPWKKSAQQEPPKTGLNIQAFIRDLLMAEMSIPIREAQSFADKVAQEIEQVSWLETSRGSVFKKGFDPADSDPHGYVMGDPEYPVREDLS